MNLFQTVLCYQHQGQLFRLVSPILPSQNRELLRIRHTASAWWETWKLLIAGAMLSLKPEVVVTNFVGLWWFWMFLICFDSLRVGFADVCSSQIGTCSILRLPKISHIWPGLKLWIGSSPRESAYPWRNLDHGWCRDAQPGRGHNVLGTYATLLLFYVLNVYTRRQRLEDILMAFGWPAYKQPMETQLLPPSLTRLTNGYAA